MIGIKDIAEHVNVSQSLVSKVLNNRMGTSTVRAELAERIRQAAIDLGYQRNESAAALAKGRHAALGVYIHHLGRAGSALIESLLKGISDEANRHHQTLMLDFFASNAQFREIAVEARRRMVDGLILAGVPHPGLIDDLLGWVATGTPIVTVHDEQIHPSILNIGMDQREVGRLATQHLIERGCKRIATVPVDDERHSGYTQALAEAGIDYEDDLVQSGRDPKMPRYAREAARRGLIRLLESGVEFDGLFTHCDEHAMEAMRLLLASGRRIPDGVKLIGVDDAPYCEIGVVPLSSISQSYQHRGGLAVHALLKLVNGNAADVATVLPEVVARASSGD